MTYIIYENGEEINRIVANESFIGPYCESNGYTYEEEPIPEPTEPIDPPELPPSLEERVADLEAENETISEVLDALLMGDIEV